MRPLRIAIEGLRSFRAEVEIDFGDRNQIAVIGDTGAGKSSILEAMTYALYGRTSLGSRSKPELMNDASDEMRVVLRFRVSGEEWEVARVDRRAGAGGLRPAKAQLVRYGSEGEEIEKVEQVTLVNERVSKLIGLDSDAFLRTVILPQGRFARLLVEDSPSERTEILRQVWRTGDLEAAGEAAGQRLAEVKALGVRLQDEVDRWPDDPEERLGNLKAEADAAKNRSVALAELRDRAERARDTLRGCDETCEVARRALITVTPAAMNDLAERLEPVETMEARVLAEETRLTDRETGLRNKLDDIPTDDGPDDGEVARARLVLDELLKLARKAEDQADELRKAITGESEAEQRHVQTKQELASSENLTQLHQDLEPPIQEAVASAREALQKTEQRYDGCSDLYHRIDRKDDALAGRKTELAEVAARLDTARDGDRAARERLRLAVQRLSEARRNSSAADATHDLCPGDECPICRNELPENWSPPQDAGLDAARESHAQAKTEADKASAAVVGLGERRQSVQDGIAEIENELGDLRSKLFAALGQLRSAAAPDATLSLAADEPLPDRARILDPAKQLLQAAEAELADHGSTANKLRQAHTDAQVSEQSALEALEYARKENYRSRKIASETLDALTRKIRSIPEPFRPQLALPSAPVELETVDTTPVDRALDATRKRDAILQQRRQEKQDLNNEIQETRTALADLAKTRRTQVDERIQALVRELDVHRTAVRDAVRDLATEVVPVSEISLPPSVHYPVDAQTLRSGIGQLRQAMLAVVELATDLSRQTHALAEEARAEAREIAARLDRPVDLDNLEALVRSTGEAATNAEVEARQATQARDDFAAKLDDLLSLRRTADKVAALQLALSDLDAALKPGAFLKWLTLRRSRGLLVHASKLLEDMTANRYSFADPGGLDDQRWLVVDNDSGQARSPASLSGGEQFIGSLALALGMVEMMAQSGGRLESLFLDEGFGSLDRSNLDSAIEALSLVAAKGRMVGVISHVGAVAEQIDDVLVVTRGGSGSRAKWLSRTERQALSGSEEGAEGASALAGLLD